MFNDTPSATRTGSPCIFGYLMQFDFRYFRTPHSMRISYIQTNDSEISWKSVSDRFKFS